MRLVKYFYFGLALLIGLLITLKSIDYYTPQFVRGFLIDKKEIFRFYGFFLYAHIIGAPFAIIIGLFQFSFKQSKWHKSLGQIYVVAVLFFAAPGGLGMSFFAVGGMLSIANLTEVSD